MDKIIGPVLLLFLNLSLSFGQQMEGLWMIAEVSIEDGKDASFGLIEFVNESVFRFSNKDPKLTGHYKIKDEKLELFIPRKYKASGYVRDSLLYLDVDRNYGIYKKWRGKLTIQSVAKKLKKQETFDLELGDHLQDGIWKIKSGPSYSYTDAHWQFLKESTAVVDYGYGVELSTYYIFNWFDQVLIGSNFNVCCHLISVMEEEIIAECFYMHYMGDEAAARQNIAFSQTVTFKRVEYPSLKEYNQMKKKITGEWEGVFVYPDISDQAEDSTFLFYNYQLLSDSILGDTVILIFHETGRFEALQKGQYINNDSLQTKQKTFIGEWELDKSLGFVIINDPQYHYWKEYLKVISIDEENGCMSSGWNDLFGIKVISDHKMVKKK